ncbi:MAG: Lrp/AsnC family transcriptional regulator [Pseudomonadota bacterium]
MDEFDAKILRALEGDGRLSNVALAERVGLSPSACLRRVQELERRGVIKGYRARLNRSMLGRDFLVYVTVGLAVHTKESQRAFERAITISDAVTECHNIAGAFEYLLRVETVDLKSFKAFHTDVLGALPQVRSITSYMVMDSPKDGRD